MFFNGKAPALKLIYNMGVLISKSDNCNFDTFSVSSTSSVTKIWKLCQSLLKLTFYKKSKLHQLRKRICWIIKLVFEMRVHFRIYLKLDSIVRSRDSLHIPLNVIIEFNTLNVLNVNLNE